MSDRWGVRRGAAADAPALARLRWRWRTEERDEVGARDRELECVTVHCGDRAVPFYLRAGFQADPNWLQCKP